jgi:hypothetical protein
MTWVSYVDHKPESAFALAILRSGVRSSLGATFSCFFHHFFFDFFLSDHSFSILSRAPALHATPLHPPLKRSCPYRCHPALPLCVVCPCHPLFQPHGPCGVIAFRLVPFLPPQLPVVLRPLAMRWTVCDRQALCVWREPNFHVSSCLLVACSVPPVATTSYRTSPLLSQCPLPTPISHPDKVATSQRKEQFHSPPSFCPARRSDGRLPCLGVLLVPPHSLPLILLSSIDSVPPLSCCVRLIFLHP